MEKILFDNSLGSEYINVLIAVLIIEGKYTSVIEVVEKCTRYMRSIHEW